MKTICLYFEIHQIIHLKRYRFFDIGIDHYYYDDYENERSITDIAERSYMPALETLLDMIKQLLQGCLLNLRSGNGAVGNACSAGNCQVAGNQRDWMC